MYFSPSQKNLAIMALGEAEDCTSKYYCIPPFRWQQVHYDLLTRQDQEWEPLPDPVLARLQRFERFSRISKRVLNFYRIQLNDPAILSVAERDNFESDIYPFLVFILTHELVHLVRVSVLSDSSHELSPFPQSEEMRVQLVANQILSSVNYPNLKPLFSKYSDIR